MKNAFWPLFVICASLGGAIVWTMAPRYSVCLPQAVRDWCYFTTLHATGRDALGEDGRAAGELTAGEREALVKMDAAFAARSSAYRHDVPEHLKKKLSENRASGVGKGVLFPQTTAVTDPSTLPAMRGVMQADPKTAWWGVTAKVTELEGFNHEDRGKTGGGRIFLIERRMRTEEGLRFVGHFEEEPAEQAVTLPAENLYCFTGKPTDLTDVQRTSLRTYYEKRAQALSLREEIVKPQYDNNGVMVQAGGDPMSDTRYRALLNEMMSVAKDIVGLTF